MPRKPRVPAYLHHKPSGRAYVRVRRSDGSRETIYLGAYDSPASKEAYRRVVAERVLLGTDHAQQAAGQIGESTVVELLAKYYAFASGHYVKDGRPTGQMDGVKATVKLLKTHYGRLPLSQFGPLKLRALQQTMIADDKSRRYINDTTARVKRIFKWAVSNELAPPSIHQALSTVPGLAAGRTAAHETEPVSPVADKDVDQTLAELSPVVADLVRFQRLTGCRPQEACLVRPSDVDASEEVWVYIPSRHKNQHRNQQRVIPIGPRAQAILRPRLERDAEAYCFPPSEASSSAKRPHYTKDSYRKAVERACLRAGVAPWSPNQLRHTRATELRKEFGIETASAVLGHAKLDTTQIYAEKNFQAAAEAAKRTG